jgi:hypothetical protein
MARPGRGRRRTARGARGAVVLVGARVTGCAAAIARDACARRHLGGCPSQPAIAGGRVRGGLQSSVAIPAREGVVGVDFCVLFIQRGRVFTFYCIPFSMLH